MAAIVVVQEREDFGPDQNIGQGTEERWGNRIYLMLELMVDWVWEAV